MHIWFSRVASAMIAATLLVGGGRAEAQQNMLVVELFTSQGCAACPPADAMLKALAMRDDVIALGLHVDYWDYIGWEDSFASAAFTRRQKQYARQWKRSSIYTPQMIVGGTEEVRDFRRDTVHEILSRQLSETSSVRLSLRPLPNGQIALRATAEPPLAREVEVMLVRYLPRATVEITSGENNGKSLTYNNIVTSFEQVAHWDGQSALELTVSAPGEQPAVIMVQEKGQGAVLAAAQQR